MNLVFLKERCIGKSRNTILNKMSMKYLKNKISSVFLILFLAAVGSSCFTLKYSTTGASTPAKAATVSVQYFQNQANYVEPDLAQDLTDALKDYIEKNTALIVVNGIGDMDFEGTIERYDTRPTQVVAGDIAAQNRFTISVKIKLNCYADPNLNFDQSFSRYEDYSSTRNFEDVKIDLTQNIQQLLIEDIFNKAFVNW